MKVAELFNLKGKRALITGGSRGLGLQMAHALGEVGASLVLVARKADELEAARGELAATGFAVDTRVADIADHESIPALVESIIAQGGPIDILVNNAGTTWGSPATDYPLHAWNKVVGLNLTSTFLLTREIARQAMLPRGAGKVINVASTAGLVGVLPEVMSTVAYHTSKGGMINMTRALAAEWAGQGITVNGLAPGFFPTKISERTLEEHGDLYLQGVPMRRFGSEFDLKGSTVLLASAASDYITGQTIVVDGGYTII